jgi:acetoin utilization protein AcuC
MGLLNGRERREIPPVMATRAELEKFHLPHYLDAIKKAEAGELSPEAFRMGIGTPDCPIAKGMFDYFSLTCGASLTGARILLSGESKIAFNPSGGYHHAGPEKASGFCYLNDIVLAAMELADAGKRVVILDLDVHHGDGVADAFYARKDIMMISLHESGKTLFPGTGFENEIGSGEGKGYTVNIPLPEGTYDSAYLEVFNSIALPLIEKYDPDVIILELGMDGLISDPLGHLSLTNNIYADIIETILILQKPLLATGGGGYHVKNTARGWALAWSVLCGDSGHDLGLGMGGVMLETTEWAGGLRDRTFPPDVDKQMAIHDEIQKILKKLKSILFPIHGLA